MASPRTQGDQPSGGQPSSVRQGSAGFPGSLDDVPIREMGADRLRMGRWAVGLKDYLLTCPTPTVIGLFGPRGSGKTSLMNLIEGEITDEAFCIRFDCRAYRSAFGDEPPGGVLTACVADQIVTATTANSQSRAESLREILEGYNAGGKPTMPAQGGSDSATHSADSLLTAMRAIRKSSSRMETMVRQALDKTGAGRVIVFIDNIDRLPATGVTALMDAIHSTLHVRGCIFLVASDGTGADSDGVLHEDDFHFTFSLPASELDIDRFLLRTLREVEFLAGIGGEDVEDYREFLRCSVGATPGAFKKALNASLLLQSLVPGVANEPVRARLRKHKILFAVSCMIAGFPRLWRVLVSTARDYKRMTDVLHGLADSTSYRDTAAENGLLNEADADEDAVAVRLLGFADTLVRTVTAHDDNRTATFGQFHAFTQLLLLGEAIAATDDTPVFLPQRDAVVEFCKDVRKEIRRKLEKVDAEYPVSGNQAGWWRDTSVVEYALWYTGDTPEKKAWRFGQIKYLLRFDLKKANLLVYGFCINKTVAARYGITEQRVTGLADLSIVTDGGYAYRDMGAGWAGIEQPFERSLRFREDGRTNAEDVTAVADALVELIGVTHDFFDLTEAKQVVAPAPEPAAEEGEQDRVFDREDNAEGEDVSDATVLIETPVGVTAAGEAQGDAEQSYDAATEQTDDADKTIRLDPEPAPSSVEQDLETEDAAHDATVRIDPPVEDDTVALEPPAEETQTVAPPDMSQEEDADEPQEQPAPAPEPVPVESETSSEKKETRRARKRSRVLCPSCKQELELTRRFPDGRAEFSCKACGKGFQAKVRLAGNADASMSDS